VKRAWTKERYNGIGKACGGEGAARVEKKHRRQGEEKRDSIN